MQSAAQGRFVLIRIENLKKTYAGQLQAALDGVSLSIPDGSVFGLLGPNGAGKTTLISILVGLQKKDGGEVWFDEQPLQQGLKALRSVMGFVPQDLAFYPMLTVAENLWFYAEAYGLGRERCQQHIDYALDATRMHEHLAKPAEQLSGGLKRRLNLAIGLLNKPRILFLDEPTVGIDPESRNFILQTIAEINRSRGTTIIYTSHYMQEVQQLCDRVAILDEGKVLLHGELQQLLDAAQSSELEFRLQQPADDALQQLLRDRFAAEGSDGLHFCIAEAKLEQLLAELPSFLQQHGSAMAGIRHGYHDLEELYMERRSKVTGG